MRKTRAVSIEGDAVFADALHLLAKNKEITVGKLVADAVHAVYGEELQPLVSFFRRGGYKSIQLEKEKDNA